MTDRATIVLALAVVAGAWWAHEVPPTLVLAGVAAAVGLRRPVILVVAALLLSALLGSRAWAGLEPPPVPVAVEGEVTLLSDPVDVDGALRVDVRVGSRRVEAWARGAPAGALRARLAGERVTLAGRLRAPPEHARPWLARRHVASRLSVARVDGWRHGHAPSRAANAVRRTLVEGAAPLDRDRRALFTGFVLGDVREQAVEVADDFRGSGLTHLLAVSGSNVAFVLTLASPLLRRLGLRSRWAATLGLIAFFALMTRFEPSVLRASAMAAIACTAGGLGRPASRRRILALAVTAVVLVDPIIVRALAFQLSVGASAGIITLSGPIARRLPGPRLLANVLAVTIAAQVGVAPILVPVFGGLPLSSIPANLLAVPAAGPLMAWGLTGGIVAGLAGPPVDWLLHLPTAALTGWVAAVARWGSGLPLGQIRSVHLIGLAAVGVATVVTWRSPSLRPVLAAVATAVLFAPAVLPPGGELRAVPIAHGAELWRAGGVVLVVDDADPGRLLDRLRLAGIDRVDVLVVRRGTRPTASTVLILRR
ncbi:MAG TPA: ComEC/Rec2 family competence protein, partial [Acidimicrobiales bacterium]|nr:ComEC/Rec2 family competence protein [Acidimicrobiales bacterium]